MVSFLTSIDAGYAFVRGIKYLSEINRKTYNVCYKDGIKYGDLLNEILKCYGISFEYIFSRLIFDKTYYSPECTDALELNEIIDFETDSLNDYLKRLKRMEKRKFAKIMAKPFIKR